MTQPALPDGEAARGRSPGCLLAPLLLLPLIGGLVLLVAFPPFARAARALGFGWAPFLRDNLARVQVNAVGIATAGLCAALLIAGLAWMLSWWGPAGAAPAPAPLGRRLRWAVVGLALVLLAFAAGIGMVGVVHQVVWLATGPTPVFDSDEDFKVAPMNLLSLADELWRDWHGKPPPRLQPGISYSFQFRRVSLDVLHLIALAGPDGAVRTVIVAPRDPALRATAGIAVMRPGKPAPGPLSDQSPEPLHTDRPLAEVLAEETARVQAR